MRFTSAWIKVASQNVTLKVATVTLTIISIFQLIIIGRLATRDAVVIERSCFSHAMTVKSKEPSIEEMKSFLFESLPMRFDTDSYFKEGLLSIEEVSAKDKEQSNLKLRQMKQRIIISDIAIEGKDILVMADRLISVGKIKSVLPLNLKITLEQTNRTESNPYGLILSGVSQVEDKEKR